MNSILLGTGPRLALSLSKVGEIAKLGAEHVMCLGSSEKELTFLGYVALDKTRAGHVSNLVEKCLSNHCSQFLCTILIITGKYCPEEQGAALT